MENKEALKLTKFYKGENDCPFDPLDQRSNYWRIEKAWVKLVLPNEAKQDNILSDFLIDCGGLDELDIPLSLKATFYEHFYHWNGSKHGFYEYLLGYATMS